MMTTLRSTLRRGALAAALLALTVTAACGDDDTVDPLPGGGGNVDHTFTYVKPASAPAVTSVNLAGTFNDWSTTARAMTQGPTGTWTTTVSLPRGTHQYKFVMNGNQWVQNMCNDATWGNSANGGKVDAAVTTCANDNNGGQNAVVVIP